MYAPSNILTAPATQPDDKPRPTFGYTLSLASELATLETTGGKGASLARLCQAGFPVPAGFHLVTEAYRRFVAQNDLQPGILAAIHEIGTASPAALDEASARIHALFLQGSMPEEIRSAITQAYDDLPGDHPVVAVRSSATAEDLPGLSFAGQQATFLNVHGIDQVLEAVQRCWASLWTARAIGYRLQHGIDQETVSLAVVVQVLVPADAAGILFTADPLSGSRDRAVITAAWGLGEAIVGGLVTPDTLIVDKAAGRVLSRETADKQQMTALLESGTQEQAVPAELRQAAVLTDEQAGDLAAIGSRIEALYGLPVDIEWALENGKVYILQARPITALPEALPPAPADWKLPKGVYAAVRNNIVELMAAPLTPLFATLGRGAINASIQRVMAAMGMPGIMPPETIITVNQYAYNNGSISAGALLNVLFHLRSIVRKMFTGAVERWTENARPRYIQIVADQQAKPWKELSSPALLDSVRLLTGAAIDAYEALVAGIIPGAWISEAIFTRVYNLLIKRREDPAAQVFLLGYDSLPIQADKSLFSLAEWTQPQAGLAAFLIHTPTPALVKLVQSGSAPANLSETAWGDWRARLEAHLDRFGHTIYNLDFANPVPADDPAPVIESFKHALRGQAADPYARQRRSAELRQGAVEAASQRLKGLRLKWFQRSLAAAQKYAPLREDGLAEVGLAYPLIRQLLSELGSRMVQAGVIRHPEDIYWLYEEELLNAAQTLEINQAANSLAGQVIQRKAEHKAALQVTPPLMLPQMKLFGVDLAALKSRRKRGGKDGVLKGVAASPGKVTALARVLHGPDDFAQLQPGEVLVASITTPAWTPLFALASAIVTDVGGPLSHGSIVAREYGIPAVLGTGVATRRIQSGQIVTVDGGTGLVLVEPYQPGAAPGQPAGGVQWTLPHPKGQYMRGSIADLAPGPMSPLYASYALPQIVKIGINKIFGSLTRSKVYLPADYITTINSYVYIGVHFSARELLWIVARLLPSASKLIRTGLTRWRDDIRPRYRSAAQAAAGLPIEDLSPAALLQHIQALVETASEYIATLLVGTTGASAGSELLFNSVYQKMVQRPGDPPAAAFLTGYNSMPVRSEKALYDLAAWIKTHPELCAFVENTDAASLARVLAQSAVPVQVRDSEWSELQDRLSMYLADFGHMVYSIDFYQPLPLDDWSPLLGAIQMYLRGEGANPHERQGLAEQKRLESTQAIQGRERGLRRWAFQKALRWGQELAEVREDAIADIGLGYPALRRMLLELGRRFVRAGAIEQPEDIFFINNDELFELTSQLEKYEALPDLAPRVAQRKTFMQQMKDTLAPSVLPVHKKKYMGFDMSAYTPASEDSHTSETLNGVPTSAGIVTAPARVLRGPEDFAQMQPGEVLVAGTTTPAWTPLFAMASAIVTDVGGPLSHGSIVAREYGIPAVMGTGVATRRIRSGQIITVDGQAGIVKLS